MTTHREPEAPPITLLERVDNVLNREANFAAARKAESKRQSRRAPQQMKRAEFKAVLP